MSSETHFFKISAVEYVCTMGEVWTLRCIKHLFLYKCFLLNPQLHLCVFIHPIILSVSSLLKCLSWTHLQEVFKLLWKWVIGWYILVSSNVFGGKLIRHINCNIIIAVDKMPQLMRSVNHWYQDPINKMTSSYKGGRLIYKRWFWEKPSITDLIH